jgi:hypothetical protein
MEGGKYADSLRAVREQARLNAKERDGKEPTRADLHASLKYFRELKVTEPGHYESDTGMSAVERQVRQTMGEQLWDVFHAVYLEKFTDIDVLFEEAIAKFSKASRKNPVQAQNDFLDAYTRIMNGPAKKTMEDERVQNAFKNKQLLVRESLEFLNGRHREIFEKQFSESEN